MTSSKNILIVGGASGIGWATVQQLISQTKDTPIIADCDERRLEEVRIYLKAKKGRTIDALKMDITDPTSIQAALEFVNKKYGKIDGLITSAAIHSSHPAEYLTDQMIDQVLNINLVAHIKFVKNILPYIQDGGRMIGISSIAAGIGVPMESLYSASKAGLEAFYSCLATELLHRNIRVSIIHPGNVNTGFNEKGNDYKPVGHVFIDEGYKRVVSRIDSSKGMLPQNVARVIIRALKTAKPKFFYAVGSNAIKAYWAKRLLGNNLALRLMAKHFGF